MSEYYETSQRMPTEADATDRSLVHAWNASSKMWEPLIIDWVKAKPINWPCWMPMPPAPKTACERAFEAAKDFLAAGNMSAKDMAARKDDGFYCVWNARIRMLSARNHHRDGTAKRSDAKSNH